MSNIPYNPCIYSDDRKESLGCSNSVPTKNKSFWMLEFVGMFRLFRKSIDIKNIWRVYKVEVSHYIFRRGT